MSGAAPSSLDLHSCEQWISSARGRLLEIIHGAEGKARVFFDSHGVKLPESSQLQDKMNTVKKLMPRVMLVALCALTTYVSLWIYFLYLPIRIYRRLFTDQEPAPPPPPPKVGVTVHEPEGTDVTPRDTLIFIHGFPDCPALYDKNIEHFVKDGYRCIAVALPGCGGERVETAIPFDELIDMIYHAVTEVQEGPVTVVGHDWGSFYTLQLYKKYPAAFKRVVLLDVGMMRQIDPSVMIAILTYQAMLALMFALGRPAGTIGVMLFLTYFGYDVRPIGQVTSDMCYPYVSMMKLLATKALQGKERQERSEPATIPFLYLYGKAKNFMFHDHLWCDFVKKSPGGEVVAMPAGHWVSYEKGPDCNALISRWLEKTETEESKE